MIGRLIITEADVGSEFVDGKGDIFTMTAFFDYGGDYPIRCIDTNGEEETFTDKGYHTYGEPTSMLNLVRKVDSVSVSPKLITPTELKATINDALIQAYDAWSVEGLKGAPETKPSNPKDSVGISKVPMSTVPATVLAEVGVAMAEGARKYGRHNYRVLGCKASVYYDATMRHLMDWWEGTDIDPDSGMSHVTKAITSLVVLRDAMIQNKFIDDRPPVSVEFLKELNVKMQDIINKYPESAPTYTKED